MAADVALAPDGTQTADKVVETAVTGNHEVNQVFSHPSGGLLASVYLKAGERTRAQLQAWNATEGVFADPLVDLIDGSIITNFHGVASTESAGNGWWRVKVWANTAQTSSTFKIRAVSSPQDQIYPGDGSSGIYAWGASDEAQSRAPMGGNLLLAANALDAAAWSKVGVEVTADDTEDPSGGLAADLVTSTGSNQWPNVYQRPTSPITSGKTYTLSTYVKQGNTSNLYQAFTGGDGSQNFSTRFTHDGAKWTFAGINRSNPVWSFVDAGADAPTNNGFQRVWIAATYNGSEGTQLRGALQLATMDSTPALYHWFWGTRLEETQPPADDGNLLRFPNALNFSPWFTTGALVLPDTAAAPDGTMTADKLIENTADSRHQVGQSFSHPTGGILFSVYLKAAELTRAQLQLYNPAEGSYVGLFVDLTNGDIIANTQDGVAQVQSAGDGWWHVSVWTETAETRSTYIIRTVRPPGTVFYPGDGFSGIYAWGAKAQPQTQAPESTTLPPGYESEILFTGLEFPTSARFSPDGRLFVTEKGGSVRIFHDGHLHETPFLTVDVDTYSERGLGNIIFDPNFATNRYVYVYYTTADPVNPGVPNNASVNRLSRFKASSFDPDFIDTAFGEQILLDNLSAARGDHNSGAMSFAADGTLFLSVGDAGSADNAQNLDSFNGKILRLDVSGESVAAAADNPFFNAADGITARDFIYAYGLRNPFTGDYDPITQKLYANNVGQVSFEEINDIIPGGNYGWPLVEGYSDNPAYINPVYAYPNEAGASITGGAFYNFDQFPDMRGKYFFADYVRSFIQVFNPATGTVSEFATNMAGTIDLDVGSDGSLYCLDIFSGSVRRISYVGDGNRTPVAAASASATNGLAPLTVQFDGGASSDPDGDSLMYSWDFGDGSTGAGRIVTHQYTSDGVYNAVLTVSDRSDGTGLSDHSEAIVITVGNRAPTGVIASPTHGAHYTGGETISFSATGSDPEDGSLPPSAFQWTIVFHHNTHTHPFLDNLSGDSGTFEIPALFETASDQWFRIHLTVTDSGGLQHSSYVDILPSLSTFTITSNVPGLSISVDDQPQQTPVSVEAVVGQTRSLSAPDQQTLNGVIYRFVSWSDGQAATHNITVPASDTTFTAFYEEVLPNNAPRLNTSFSPALDSIDEDVTNPAGSVIAQLLAGVSDADAGALQGAAITSLPKVGLWEYSLDGGSSWIAVGAATVSSALLLRSTDLLRLTPTANYNGTATLWFRAWDQTDGQSAGSLVDTGTAGGTTAYSKNIDSATLTVGPVNDAPRLNTALSPALDSIAEDSTDSPGTAISQLLIGASDIDPGAVSGIAITSLPNVGAWEYSLDGSTWSSAGPPSVTAALLLRATDLLRLIPKANYNGTATVWLRVWDQTDAQSPGSIVDTSVNGGTTAYSQNVDRATVVITPVNDAPKLNTSFSPTLTSVSQSDPNPAGTAISQLLAGMNDVDAGGLQGAAITHVPQNVGIWEYSLDDGSTWTAVGAPSVSGALLLRATDRIRLKPKPDYTGTVNLWFRAWDESDGLSAGSIVDTSINGGTTAYSKNTESASITVTP